jgi:cytochrome P450
MTITIPGPGALAFASIRYAADPVAYYTWCRRRYGTIFRSPTPYGPLIVVGSAEGARQVYAAPSADAFPLDMLGPLLGARGLLALSGGAHRAERKLLMPPFHGERLRGYAALMTGVAERALRIVPVGASVRAIDLTQRVSLEVILAAVLGVPAGSDEGRALAAAVVAYTGAMTPSTAFFPALRRQCGPWAAFCRRRDHLDALLLMAIDRARSEPGDSILRLMLEARYEGGDAMSEEALLDELRTLLFAGHETTAVALAWALYYLHQPSAESMRDHATSDSAYLDAVCQEALRIHPVVVDTPRLFTEDRTVLGHAVRAGSAISVSPILVHSDAETWPTPDRFDPSRFIGVRPEHGAMVAFGGGSRRCIGAAFATLEMRQVLGVLLSQASFRLASTTPERPVRRGFVMGPSRGVDLLRLA